jgi:hypothetical protein
VTQRFDTEAMARALLEHDASGLGCLGREGWDWDSQAADVRATRIADAGQLIQRYITRAEEGAPPPPTAAPTEAGPAARTRDGLFSLEDLIDIYDAASGSGNKAVGHLRALEALASEAAARAERAMFARLETMPAGKLVRTDSCGVTRCECISRAEFARAAMLDAARVKP